MTLTRFPNGIESMGIPLPFGVVGTVFFVDSNNGSDGNTGKSSSKPLATIDKAMGLCTDNKNDVILLMPGHAENVAAATEFLVDKAGVTIVGLGSGTRIPTFSTTAAAGTLSVTAANAYIKNVRMTCNYTGGGTQAILVDAAADGLTLDGVQCRDTTNAKEWLIHVSGATTVLGLTIKNCDFIGLIAGSMTNSILFAGTTSDLRLLNNHIDVDSSDSTIDHDAGIATNVLIEGNTVLNQDTTAAGYCIEVHASSTGHMVKNMCSYAKNDAPVYLGEALFWLENYGVNTAGSSGELDPAAAAIP